MSVYSIASEGGLMIGGTANDFIDIRSSLAERLLKTEPENFGKWQQLDVSKSSIHATYELLNTTIWYAMPNFEEWARKAIFPDLPWAEAHFQERVGGKAINPGVEHANWPYHANGAELHLKNGHYDHNYMERIWPKGLSFEDDGEISFEHLGKFTGYRFPVGDLNDVVNQLRTDIGTRQAYLPIWFPEDTGATAGQRVPCSLGYHFIVRDGLLHCQYNLRSCEIYRHFTNDTYMAVRLAQWVRDRVSPELDMGQLTMNIVSLHGFVGDTEKIEGLV